MTCLSQLYVLLVLKFPLLHSVGCVKIVLKLYTQPQWNTNRIHVLNTFTLQHDHVPSNSDSICTLSPSFSFNMENHINLKFEIAIAFNFPVTSLGFHILIMVHCWTDQQKMWYHTWSRFSTFFLILCLVQLHPLQHVEQILMVSSC